MRRKRVQVTKENHERWLITYSDLITLLLIFFIIMYAMSSINIKKFNLLSVSLNQALSPNNQIPLSGLGNTALLAAQNATQSNQTGMSSLTKQEIGQISSMVKEDRVFNNLYHRLESYVKQHELQNSVSIANQERGVQITLRDVVFFNTGQDRLRIAAQQTLQKMVPFLMSVPNDIIVEGYTDNVPIRTYLFPSNWELSTGRAVNVLRFLIAQGIDPNRLSATGYGKYHPLVPNTTAANRQENRRVNVVILKNWVSSIAEFGGQKSTTNEASVASISQTPAHKKG